MKICKQNPNTSKILVLLFVAVAVCVFSCLSAFAAVSVLKRGIVAEAENMTLNSTYAKKTFNKDASGMYTMKIIKGQSDLNAVPSSEEAGHAEYEFTAEDNCLYNIWVRYYSTGASSDSVYVAIDGKTNYISHAFPKHGAFLWQQLEVSVDADKGETYKLKFYSRENGFIIDQVIITGIIGYEPPADSAVSSLPTQTEITLPDLYNPPYTPPTGHPRVYFTNEHKDKLIENLNHPSNEPFKKLFDAYVAEKVDIGASPNIGVTDKIQCKAYSYALFGNESVGRDAVELALATMTEWPILTNVDVETRMNGMLILTWAEVYDWCYSLLSDEEKQLFIDRCITSASVMEIGWPPNKQGAVDGHGAEAQLLRDLMAFAIAVYDERPDYWNYIGGRFYEEYVPPRLFFYDSGMHIQGASYGVYRNTWDLHAYKLITGMGLPEPYPADKVAGMDKSRLVYLRRPDGNLTLDGDMPSIYTYPMTYGYGAQAALLLASSVGNDPYLKDEYVRATFTADKEGFTRKRGEGDESTIADHLMFSNPDLKPKSIANLPLSEYYPSPMGVMAARTGWGDGVSDDSVVAEMKIGEYFIGGHQVPAAGHFSIYYKGPLTNQSGVYDIFESPAFNHYNHHSVASNTILVYDPDEPEENFKYAANDGGQMIGVTTPPNPIDADVWTPTPEDEYHRASVDGHEIDPKNPSWPDYTYLKGDITGYYSDKVTDYKRSMMFLNLKDGTIPAVMVVFDKISVKNPQHKKTWVLHGQTYPEILDGRTVWYSNPCKNTYGEEYTGKMVHDILLPSHQNLSKTVVGGEEDGWNIVNGVNVPGNTNNKATAEENTYRLELSPTANNETELFLNVIQVTDKDNEVYHNALSLDTGIFAGVKIADRVVLFSKDGERVSANITFDVDGTGTLKYTICDIAEGVWSVAVGGTTQNCNVTKEGGVLSFEAAAGQVSAVRISDLAYDEESEPVILSNKKTYYIKVDNVLVNQPVDAYLSDGVLMAPVDSLTTRMLLSKTGEFERIIYRDSSQKIEAQLTPGSDIIIVDGVEKKMQKEAQLKDGYLMVDIKIFAEVFNFVYLWDDWSETAYLVSNPQPPQEELVFNVDIPDIAPKVQSMTISEQSENPGVYDVSHASSKTSAKYTAFSLEAEPLKLEYKGSDSKYPFSRNTIVRYSAQIDTAVDTDVFYLYAYFSDGTSVYRDSTYMAPKANEKIKLDIVVDLGRLHVYYYINNKLVKFDNTYKPAEGITELSLSNVRVQLGNSSIVSPSKLFEVSNIRRYVYSYGTEINTVVKHLGSEPLVTSVVPVSQQVHRWTVNKNAKGIYDVTVSSNNDNLVTQGGIKIPVNVDMSDTSEGFVRASAVITPVGTGLYNEETWLNALYTVDGNPVYDNMFCNDKSIVNVGTTRFKAFWEPVRLDMVYDKATHTVYYFADGRKIGTTNYTPSENTSATLEAMGIYFAAYGLDNPLGQKDVAVTVSNVKKYIYSSAVTIDDIQREIEGTVTSAVLTYARRGDAAPINPSVILGKGLRITSQDTVQTALNYWLRLPQAIEIENSVDKFAVVSTTLSIVTPANILQTYIGFFMDNTDSGINGASLPFLRSGQQYRFNAVFDMEAKKVYYFIDDLLLTPSGLDISSKSFNQMRIYSEDGTADGVSQGEVEQIITDFKVTYYGADYKGNFSDVLNHQKVSPVENPFYIQRAFIKKSQESYFWNLSFGTSVPDNCKVFVAAYKTNPETLYEKLVYSACADNEHLSGQLPADFDSVRVFVWDSKLNPLQRHSELALFGN